MSTYSFSGVFLLSAGSTLIPAANGLSVTAWKASRFGSPPPYGTAFPTGTADASTTIGTTAGSSAGGFTIALPTSEPYYIACTSATGINSWQLANSSQYKDGTSGSTAEVDPPIVGTIPNPVAMAIIFGS